MDIIESAKKKIESEITDIENRTDLSEDEKRSRIIHIFSVTCAAVAVQPIPFADIFVLTPIQAYMGVRLSAIRGMPLSEAEATDLLKEVAGIVGLGMAAQQIALGLYKVGLPGLAGFTTIPLVYGLTYAIGRVMDYYLEKKSKGQTVSKADLKNMWGKFREEGKEQAKKAKDEVEKKKSQISLSEEALIKKAEGMSAEEAELAAYRYIKQDVALAITEASVGAGKLAASLFDDEEEDVSNANTTKKAKDEVVTKKDEY